MNKLLQRATIFFLRPYISLELPGWGRLYSTFVGDYRRDPEWAWLGRRWVRGKLHNHEMPLDLGQWSNRMTFFLRRLYDLPTQLVLKQILRSGDTFIDIGGNEGAISLLASHLVGPNGRVIAFEPNPTPRQKFEATIERNSIQNIILQPIGLGSESGQFTMTAPKINSGEGSFGRSNYRVEEIETIECEVQRGDDVLAGSTPALIKIDVEGFELHVMIGLAETLAKSHPPVVMEMISSHLSNCGTTSVELASFMTDAGYSSFKIGVKRNWFKFDLDLIPTDIGPEINTDILWLA